MVSLVSCGGGGKGKDEKGKSARGSRGNMLTKLT